jgi:eukaryotic-like serine/threonine-protein kinase
VQQDVDVPNVIGMQVNQARRTLQDAGFKVAVEQQSDEAPAGQVIGQDPGGGTAAPPGSTVTIVVSASDPQP